jgi:thymidylate synthase
MYAPDYAFKTIRETQIELLHQILYGGDEIEDTLEVTNISICIEHPNPKEDLSDLVTPIAEKHMDQMMLKPNYKLEKTHFERLHNWETIPLCEIDQVEEVIERLKENHFSKRCVLTLWQPNDISDKYALSWTFSQLFIRDNKLIMTNYFRSCDIYNALPWNILGIANLQKYIADRLEVETGEFNVHIGSAHIYKVHIEKIKEYLNK